MKKLLSLLLAFIFGIAITIIFFHFRIASQGERINKVPLFFNKVPAGKAMYTVDSNDKPVPLDFTGAAEMVMPGVVHITSTQKIGGSAERQQQLPDEFEDFFRRFFGPEYQFQNPDEQNSGPDVRIGSGSGVIINGQGYIITNNHVIKDADEIEVTLHDNRTYKGKVIGVDASTDLALVQIDETGLDYIPFANSDDVKVGEWVLAVGNPFNLTSTVTAGIVSAKARNINILHDQYAIESFIQTDAAINPGNSGGALVNINGGLVGINTAIASPTGSYAGYGFAVPSNIVSKVVKDLLEYGVVERGYLGVTIRGVTSSLAREKDLDVSRGVYVDSIMPESAAAEAGIKENDVILKINDRNIYTAPELQEMIARQHPGDRISITVDRSGDIKELTARLKPINAERATASKETNQTLGMLGADLEEVDKSTAKKLNIDGGVEVKKLYSGKLKRQTNIKEGFIITSIDHKPVKTVDDVVKMLSDVEGGVLIEGVYEGYPGEYYYALGS